MENNSLLTWVLVYDDDKKIIAIVEPGYKTVTSATLVEFDSREELNEFIIDNDLTYRDENGEGKGDVNVY